MVQKHPGISEQYEYFSNVIPEIIEKIPEDNISLNEFLDLIGQSGKLILSMLLAAPFLIPISIPGTGVIVGFIIFTMSISLIFDKDLIPNRFRKTKISNHNLTKTLNITFRALNYLERYVKPRLLIMTNGTLIQNLNKFFFLLSSLLFIFPLPVPLTDTLPASGIFLLAAGILEDDGYLIIAGYIIVIVTVAYFGTVTFIGLTELSRGLSYYGF